MSTDLLQEMFEKTSPEPNSGCWLWTGACGPASRGYRAMYCGGGKKVRRAARVIYAFLHGEIPNGMLICHHCDTPACINPDHLFLGTHKDNVQDMLKKGRGKANETRSKTHCVKGHPLSGANLRFDRTKGGRVCRACSDTSRAAFNARAKQRTVPVRCSVCGGGFEVSEAYKARGTNLCCSRLCINKKVNGTRARNAAYRADGGGDV